MKTCITLGRLTAIINYLQISGLWHHKGLCLVGFTQCNANWWEWGVRGVPGEWALPVTGTQEPTPLLFVASTLSSVLGSLLCGWLKKGVGLQREGFPSLVQLEW